ncbi:hypothetical protein AAY473_019932 [Plecturocebus cupreus]
MASETHTPSALGDVSATCGHIGSTSDLTCPCLHVNWKVVSGCRSPRALESGAGHCSSQAGPRQRAHGSVNFDLTAHLEAHGIFLCLSKALPASPDGKPIPADPVGSKIGAEEESETPAGILKLLLHHR